ncbi:hypothetical protein ACTG2K_22775 [Aeromonas caviae]
MFSFVYFRRNWLKLVVKSLLGIALFLILGFLAYILYLVWDEFMWGGAL